MKMSEITSPAQLEVKTDRFGRRYPYRIVLQNGEQFIGLYSGSSSNDKGFEKIWFKVVEDMDEWIHNRDYIGTRMVYLKPEEIDELAVVNPFS
jgi:hypothetical protein